MTRPSLGAGRGTKAVGLGLRGLFFFGTNSAGLGLRLEAGERGLEVELELGWRFEDLGTNSLGWGLRVVRGGA